MNPIDCFEQRSRPRLCGRYHGLRPALALILILRTTFYCFEEILNYSEEHDPLSMGSGRRPGRTFLGSFCKPDYELCLYVWILKELSWNISGAFRKEFSII